eukprot:Opistho-2@28074
MAAVDSKKKFITILIAPTKSAPATNNVAGGTDAQSGDVVRVAFTEKTSFAALDRNIRVLCKIKAGQEYYLTDAEGDNVSIDGAMAEGRYILRLLDKLSADESDGCDDSSDDDKSKAVAGALKVEKVHHSRGHEFVARHFHAIELCFHCKQFVAGFGKQGYKCGRCKSICHKKCYEEFSVQCGDDPTDLEVRCDQCKEWYTSVTNGDAACKYHPSAAGGVCKNCQQPVKGPGCTPSRHKPMVVRGIMSVRKIEVNFIERTLLFDTAVRKKAPTKELQGPSSGLLSENFVPTVCPCTEHYPGELLLSAYGASVQGVYDLMVTDSASLFEELQKDLKYTEIQMQPWTAAGEEMKRNLQYVMPLTGSFGPKQALTKEEQSVKWTTDRKCFIVEAKSTTPDVPYGDTFYNVTRYCVTALGDESCAVRITGDTVFTKKPMVKGMIQKAAFNGAKGYMKNWDDKLLGRTGPPKNLPKSAAAGATGPLLGTAADSAKGERGFLASFASGTQGIVVVVLFFVITAMLFTSFMMYLRISEMENVLLSIEF